jgi:hypothetical protein
MERLPFLVEDYPHNLLIVRSNIRVQSTVCHTVPKNW